MELVIVQQVHVPGSRLRALPAGSPKTLTALSMRRVHFIDEDVRFQEVSNLPSFEISALQRPISD